MGHYALLLCFQAVGWFILDYYYPILRTYEKDIHVPAHRSYFDHLRLCTCRGYHTDTKTNRDAREHDDGEPGSGSYDGAHFGT